MRGGIENLSWINDEDGKEYVCYSDDVGEHTSFEELTEEQKKACSDVNQLVGTERW